MTRRISPLSALHAVYNLATVVAGVAAWIIGVAAFLERERAFPVEEERDWWRRGGDLPIGGRS